MIDYHYFAEQLISDLALDLAYTLANTFGEHFESWLRANQTSSANTKVEFFQTSSSLSKKCLQVRQFVRAWESSFGEAATPQAMVEALQRVKPKPQDIIDKISKNCL